MSVVLAACCLLLTLPLWLHGASCGHDFDFHLQSWLQAARDYQHGLLSPHWVAGANYGAGEPRLVFYPPLSWELGAALGAVLPWAAVPAALTGLVLCAAAAAFYGLARLYVGRPAALLGAALYAANPYMLFVAYERTAYGELVGAVFAPLLVRGVLQGGLTAVALAQAGLWLSNGPAAVMGAYACLCVGAWCAVRQASWAPAVRAALGVALGTGLAAVYVVPAAYERPWVQLARAVEAPMRVQDSFLFGHTADAFHDQVLRTASWIAIALLLAGGAALAVAWGANAKRGAVLGLGVSLAAFACLLLPASLPVYTLAPELHLLQFPWRWLLFAGSASGVAVSLAAHRVLARAGRHGWWMAALTAVLLCVVAGAWAGQGFAQSCDEEDNVGAQLQLPSGPGFEGTDEYTPQGADNSEVQQGLPPVRLLAQPGDDEGDSTRTPNPDWVAPSAAGEGSFTVEAWEAERVRVTVQASRPEYAVLRLMDYPAWRVTENGTGAARVHRDDGLLTVAVPAGRTTLEVSWGPAPDIPAGRAVSGLSAIALLLLHRRGRKRRL